MPEPVKYTITHLRTALNGASSLTDASYRLAEIVGDRPVTRQRMSALCKRFGIKIPRKRYEFA